MLSNEAFEMVVDLRQNELKHSANLSWSLLSEVQLAHARKGGGVSARASSRSATGPLRVSSRVHVFLRTCMPGGLLRKPPLKRARAAVHVLRTLRSPMLSKAQCASRQLRFVAYLRGLRPMR